MALSDDLHGRSAARLLLRLFSLAVPLLVVGIIAGCDEKDKKAESDRLARRQAEIAKFATSDLAHAEIERRLSKRLVREGLTIVVTDIYAPHTVYVMPISTPWVVSCGVFGLTVHMGSSYSDHELVSVDIIPLGLAGNSLAPICKDIAPILGNFMARITYAPPIFR